MGPLANDRTKTRAAARRVVLDPLHPEFGPILEAAHIIRQGGIVAYPTETFYGLAADPFNGPAVARLFELKGRPSGRPMLLLVSRPEQIYDLANVTGVRRRWCEKLMRAFWPGPLTLVLPARERLECPALGGGDTVAVRLSSHPTAWQLARTTGSPITSTSANLTGGAPVTSAAAVDETLLSRIDLILDAGDTPGGLASTLLDLTQPRPTILRQGAIDADRIESVIAVAPRAASDQGAMARPGGGAL